MAVDLRGHGESSGRWLTYGVRESADLKALVDRLAERRLLAGGLGPIAGLIPRAVIQSLVDTAGHSAGFDPDDASPRCVVSRFHGSLLLIHGLLDPRIPWRESAEIRDAASGASDVRLMLVPKAGHLDIGEAPGVQQAIDRWLDEHLVPSEHAGR